MNQRRRTTATRRGPAARRRRPPQVERELHELPRGLLSVEREWMLERALQVGGLTAAFRHLVQLGILHDASVAMSVGADRVARRAREQGLSHAEVERRVDAWCRTRATWALSARFINALSWRHPSAPDGYGDGPQDDPAEPLPRATLRWLIVEGRPFFKK